MCFSETASFTAAAILALQGALTVKLVKKKKSFLFIALIPFLFAIQQFSEGILWHYFNKSGQVGEGPPLIAAYIYLTFAFFVWPLFIPLSLWVAEKRNLEKWILFLFVIASVVWSLYLISTIPYLNLTVTNKGYGFIYDAGGYFSSTQALVMKFIYFGLVLIPIFVSSLRWISLFGLLAILFAGVSQYFYTMEFTSVWCFFAAIMSLTLYKILKLNK